MDLATRGITQLLLLLVSSKIPSPKMLKIRALTGLAKTRCARWLVYLTQAPSFLLKPPTPCTAGAKIPLSLPNFNSTAKTDSQNAKAPTSTLSNHGNTTPALPTQALTATHSPSAPKSTNHLAPAICPESITPLFNLCSHQPPSA